MNAETAVVVAIVVAVSIVLSVSLVFSGSLDQVGQSLFGENSEGQGFFTPEGGNGYEFPTGDESETQDSSGNLAGIRYGRG
ncbi:MAG: hypothetical protein ACI9LV_000056 [Candidatus Nanohaloarchaea archaeon]|jgi:hypothetical protein